MRKLTCFCSIGLLVAGCQSADEPLPTALTADIAATALVGMSNDEQADAPAAGGDRKKIASKQPVAANFDPPFPQRTELFEPPRGGQGMVRRDDEHGETIELKGFVDVDGPQVVLAIDGVISPIPEGGEKYGVQVISIHPPSVVLQRGRSRWTASLE